MAYYVTFRKADESISVGIALREENAIIDIPACMEALMSEGKLTEGTFVPKDMLELIEQGANFTAAVPAILSFAAEHATSPYRVREDEITVMAPIPRPTKNVFAVGLNYKKHNVEFTGSDDVSQYPIIFTKAPTSVTGPESPVESYPQYTDQLDYEAELAVIIGKKGKDIPKEQALDYIFGYTIINDISVRNRQKRTSQWFIGKSMDTHCPMGPYLADKSEMDWPVELEIMSRVNGETRQHSNTSLLLFDIPTIISVLSEGATLEPGDVIATGTCEGVGMGFNPPRFLKKGDVVEIEIEKLGVLKNTIV